jgi:hypothetical protein
MKNMHGEEVDPGKSIYAPGAKAPQKYSRYPNVGGALDDVLKTVGGQSGFNAERPAYYGRDWAEGERANADSARGLQASLTQSVRERALGLGGPSVAEQQMGRGLHQAQRQIGQQAASARGMNRGAAQYGAMQAQSDAAAGVIGQTGTLRAQEQIAAQQLALGSYNQMRLADLTARGYSIEEAVAVMNAANEAQGMNRQTQAENAKNAQGPALMGLAAGGGLLAGLSDERAKEFMYSDFEMKEPAGIRPAPARFWSIGQPPAAAAPPVTTGGPVVAPSIQIQPQNLEVAQPTGEDPTAQQRLSRALAGGAGASESAGSGDLGQSAQTGFNIGSALGGILSDKKAKEAAEQKGAAMGYASAIAALGSPAFVPAAAAAAGHAVDSVQRGPMKKARVASGTATPVPQPAAAVPPPGYAASTRSAMTPGYMLSDYESKELDELVRKATAFGGPSQKPVTAEQSREHLGPVDPQRYIYKPEHAARMASESVQRAEAATGGALTPQEGQRLGMTVFADKRTPRDGFTAQQLEQSPGFKDSVIQGELKRVDMERGLSQSIAEQAGLDKRLRALEENASGFGGESETTKLARGMRKRGALDELLEAAR